MVRRSGTKFVNELIDQTKVGRLLPFVFSAEVAFVIEMGENRARFIQNEAMLVAPTHNFLDAAVTVADDTITTTGDHYYTEQGAFRRARYCHRLLHC